MTRAVIVVDKEVQDEEYIYPYYRLQEANFQLDVAVPNLEEKITGKYGIPIRGTISYEQLSFYDLVVIPGGWAPERMRQNYFVLNFIRDHFYKNKLIGAICHGPQVLISAKLLQGKKVTAYQGIKDDITNAGGIYVDAPVVRDGNLVTSPHYRNNPEFMRELCSETF